jgi:hypothetical protein
LLALPAAKLEETRNGVGAREGRAAGVRDVSCCTDVTATADNPIEERREEKKGKKRRKAEEDTLKALL